MQELNNIMNQIDLAYVYRTFHANTKNYTLFSETHETFSKISHILGDMILIWPLWIKVGYQQQQKQ